MENIVDKKDQEEVVISGRDMVGVIRAVQHRGADCRFKVSGSSMGPAIRGHDVVTVSPLGEAVPFVGEVVAFRHPEGDRLILHRVVRRRHRLFSIRGDSLRKIDAPIPLDNILGLITGVERDGRAIFWPHRGRRPLTARLYFRGYLAYLAGRRTLKSLYRYLKSWRKGRMRV
jgi:hypothetical protein